ncbi:unnamed protein product [Urochloa humidicola]
MSAGGQAHDGTKPMQHACRPAKARRPAAEAEAEAAPAGSLWMDVSGHHPPPFRLILLLPPASLPLPPSSRPHRHKSWHRSRFAGSQLRRSRERRRQPLPLAQAIDVRAMNGYSRKQTWIRREKGTEGQTDGPLGHGMENDREDEETRRDERRRCHL